MVSREPSAPGGEGRMKSTKHKDSYVKTLDRGRGTLVLSLRANTPSPPRDSISHRRSLDTHTHSKTYFEQTTTFAKHGETLQQANAAIARREHPSRPRPPRARDVCGARGGPRPRRGRAKNCTRGGDPGARGAGSGEADSPRAGRRRGFLPKKCGGPARLRLH